MPQQDDRRPHFNPIGDMRKDDSHSGCERKKELSIVRKKLNQTVERTSEDIRRYCQELSNRSAVSEAV